MATKANTKIIESLGAPHGTVVLLRADGTEEEAVVDVENYRGAAFTVPGEGHILYPEDLHATVEVHVTGERRDGYDHRETLGDRGGA